MSDAMSKGIPKYKIRSEGDHYLVKFHGDNEYYVINDTGKDILEYLEQGGEFTAIQSYVEERYEGFTGSQWIHVEAFVKELERIIVEG